MRWLIGGLPILLYWGSVVSAAPVQHLFYSHGYIVEGENPRPAHPRYGVYDFPAIVAALERPGRVVHARHRPAGQSVDAHARVLADEVRALLQQGVRPEQIVLLGFSRGGVISLKASEYLQQPRLRLVLLASCFSGLARRGFQPVGQLYSLYESSDSVGSCRPLLQQWPDLHLQEERNIHTGLAHGAFFQPRAEWLDILAGWLDNPAHAKENREHSPTR